MGLMEEMSARQREIMTLVREIGRVGVDDLALRFAVTPQTIRKDLNELCARRLLQRVHGGAVVASGVENLGYEARRLIAQEEKERIGREAARLIPNDSSLFINIGTTTEAVARALVGHEGLLIITNNINVANILYQHPRIDVILAGGLVRRTDGGIVGEATVELIRQFKVDHAVIGASALDTEGDLLDYDHREVRVSQAIIANARRVILVADKTKLQRTAPVRIGHLSQVDVCVTDAPMPPALGTLCREEGVEVVCAQSHAALDIAS